MIKTNNKKDKKKDKSEIMTMIIDIFKGNLQTLEDLRARMSNIIISMAFLVIMSLLMIFFTKINPKSNLAIDNNLLISIGLSFIIFYAIYCIIILVYELHAMMEWKRRVDFLFPLQT